MKLFSLMRYALLLVLFGTLKAQTPTYTIEGPDTIIAGTTHRYQLNATDLPQQPQGFQFWLEGAGQVYQLSQTTADIYFSPYYSSGRVCIGMNFGTFPYYIQTCKTVSRAPLDYTISVNPNPSAGEFSFYYSSSSVAVYDLQVINNATGEVKFTMNQVSHPVVVFGRYYTPGSYTVIVHAGGLTKTLNIVKL